MKIKYWLLLFLLYTPFTRAQNPVFKNVTPIVNPNLKNKFFFFAKPSLVKIDPTGPVKYIFADRINFAEVTGRTAVQPGDFISLEVVINNKIYTLTPERGINIENTLEGNSNITLSEISAGQDPRVATLWKITGNAAGYSLNYMGGSRVQEIDNSPHCCHTLNQAGLPEVAPAPAGSAYLWRM